jgi:hypothetical protein
MSFKIKYQNEFLDIAPGQAPEIERRSPLFLLDDILAEYTTPFTLAYSDKNSRLIGYYFFDGIVKTQKKIDVEVYDNGTFRYAATMVIESAGMNFLHAGAGTASGYLLLGISDFFSTIKDKKLSELVLGGDRIFSFTTTDPLDASDGYWQHFQNTYNGTFDYVMLPCKNLGYTDDDIEFSSANEWMNKYDGTKIAINQPVVPWPKLQYVLTQLFAENGWTLDTSGLNDTEWQKLLMYSNHTISTTLFSWSGSSIATTNINEITINLAQAMPPGVKIRDYLLAICKRYLWAPVFDIGTHTCRLIALKEIINRKPKDWTKFASPISASDFSLIQKIFAFKNNINGEDQYPQGIDLTQWGTPGFVFSEKNLPDPNAANYDNSIYYTFLENKYWQVFNDNTGTTKNWIEYGDNIYNDDTNNATDTFETDCSTVPVKRVQMENGHYGLFPIVNQAKRTNWGIRTVIYHGMTQQVDEDNSPLGTFYPYGSSINIPPGSTPILAWSNVYIHNNFINDYGIVEYWAKKWLQIISTTEEITQRIYLPLHELIKFRWDSIYLIRNIPYLVKSFVEPVNYTGYIECKLQKVKLVSNPVDTSGGGGDTSTDAHFTDQHVLFEDSFNYVALQYLKGEPGATITITVHVISQTSPDFVFQLNSIQYFDAQTFNITLDGTGNGSFNVKIFGSTTHPSIMVVQLEITATSIGVIGTPATVQHDKVI